jgi:sulfate permease, SulP family
VVIAAVIELVDLAALAALWRIATARLCSIYGVAARPDFLAALAALAGVLVFDTLPGLFIGIAVSLLLLLYRASRPHVAVLGQVPGMPGQYGDVARHPENLRPPGVALLRVEAGLFFANADTVRDAVRAHAAEPGTRAVVVDAETAPFIDVSAARMLILLAGDLERAGVELAIARDVGQVRDVLRRAETGTALPPHLPDRAGCGRRPRRPRVSLRGRSGGW